MLSVWCPAIFPQFQCSTERLQILILTMQTLPYTCHSHPYNKVIVVLLTSNCPQQSMSRACTPFSRFVFLVCTCWLRSNTLEGKDFHLHLAKNGFSLAHKRQKSKTRNLHKFAAHTQGTRAPLFQLIIAIITGFVSASRNMRFSKQ